MADLFSPLTFHRGPAMKNRFMLAPLTNCQSHADGSLSDAEFHWLTMRAKGGFGLTMTCASHVQAIGQGFPGQLGIFADRHIDGLTRLASGLKAHDTLAIVQLHHAGMRADKAVISDAPVAPSVDEETGARALSTAEVEQLIQDFIQAAIRAEDAGFDGVEIHGAHGYILSQFLSPELNRREDRYGGDPQGRARIIHEIINGIRARTRADFHLGLRLSPERFGLKLLEIRDLAADLLAGGALDLLDMSLWDVFKEPTDPEHKGRSLWSYFNDLPRGQTRVGAAGKITSADASRRALESGMDFIVIGRAAVLHHDFPQQVKADPNFVSATLPVTADYLQSQGLSPKFVTYMGNWPGFVAA
jgi:2,4-dienoyl-CoA reductase-like NADH-dependent reductase (Old Yellow Enzyme family)